MDFQSRKKVILFGASEAGRCFYEKYRDQYQVLAFVDNDEKKHGQLFCDLPVVAPEQITEFDYQFIIVCSIFVFQIRKQLIEDLGVSSDKILFTPKDSINGKSLHPLEDERTLVLAREMIVFLQNLFWKNDISCFLDHGTLLGIIRDGDLLPWDDDVDLTVSARQIEAATTSLKNAHACLPRQKELNWQLILGVQELDALHGSRPVFLALSPTNCTHIRHFTIEISLNYIVGDMAVQMLNSAPAHFFQSCEWINCWGHELAVPLDYLAYLEYHYGNWQVPQKGMSFYDIRNFREPAAPTKRVRLM